MSLRVNVRDKHHDCNESGLSQKIMQKRLKKKNMKKTTEVQCQMRQKNASMTKSKSKIRAINGLAYTVIGLGRHCTAVRRSKAKRREAKCAKGNRERGGHLNKLLYSLILVCCNSRLSNFRFKLMSASFCFLFANSTIFSSILS